MISRIFLLAFLMFAGLAHAQQYRWVDKNGRIQYTDTPPPASAKDVRKTDSASGTAKPAAAALPFELARLQQDFPVTLYSSPPCKEGCDRARALLNKRGVPFTEVQVWDEASHEKLKSVAGSSEEVPVLTVGRSVQKGFAPEAFNGLLDSAGYPGAGLVPARSQGAPSLPEGYASPDAKPVSKAASAEAARKAGPYDPSGLQGAPQKPGPYGVPGDTK